MNQNEPTNPMDGGQGGAWLAGHPDTRVVPRGPGRGADIWKDQVREGGVCSLDLFDRAESR